MSETSVPLSNRASKRRIDEIDETISAISESIKNLHDMNLHSKLLGAKLKKEKLVALQAIAKSQVMLAEMDVLIAENELHNELTELKNCKKLKRANIDRSRKKERSSSRKTQSRSFSSKKKTSATLIPVKANTCEYIKSCRPVQVRCASTEKSSETYSQEQNSNNSVNKYDPQSLGSITKEHCTSAIDPLVKEYDLKHLPAVRNEALNSTIAIPSIRKECLISCSVEKVVKDCRLKPSAPLSPPNTHTNLNNISNLLNKPNSNHAQKYILKNSNQNLNNPDLLKVEKIPKIKNRKRNEPTCSGHSKNKCDMSKHMTNTHPKVSQANAPLIQNKKSIQAKPNRDNAKAVEMKRNETTKKDCNIHQEIINDLFKEIMQSKFQGKPCSPVSDNTELFCGKCGFVSEDHMCEYTIREILEN